jgi:hypothetical protein
LRGATTIDSRAARHNACSDGCASNANAVIGIFPLSDLAVIRCLCTGVMGGGGGVTGPFGMIGQILTLILIFTRN